MHDDAGTGGMQAAADRGAEALGAAGDEHALAGEGQGRVHGAGHMIEGAMDDVTIPEPLRRVAAGGFAP
jgi:hypothetical protein